MDDIKAARQRLNDSISAMQEAQGRMDAIEALDDWEEDDPALVELHDAAERDRAPAEAGMLTALRDLLAYQAAGHKV